MLSMRMNKFMLLIFSFLQISHCDGKNFEILDFFGKGYKDYYDIRFASLKPNIATRGAIGTEFTICASLLFKVNDQKQYILQILDDEYKPWFNLYLM